jgi:predicted DNA-binding transcriptional regulator YafY
MNRFDRIIAILIQLQAKKIVTAQEIANRFEISLRTVYRDIRSLEEAGVPIIAEAGVGYSIMDGYRLPPIIFTKDEALTFITAEKLMTKFTDYSLDEQYKSAMYKIKSVLKNSDKNFIATTEESIIALPNSCINVTNGVSMHLILQGITTKTLLSIEYFANHSQELTQREIEPLGIFHLGNYWYLVAFCELRNDYRNFRIDRISTVRLSNRTFVTVHPPLKDFIKKISQEKPLQTIVIRMNKEIYPYLGEQQYYNGLVSKRVIGDIIEVTFLTASLEGFARWYMTFGDAAEIMSPPHLKESVRTISKAILEKLNK